MKRRRIDRDADIDHYVAVTILVSVWQDGSPQSSPAFNTGIGRIWIALYEGEGRAEAFLQSAAGRAVSNSFMVKNRFGQVLWLWLSGLATVEAGCHENGRGKERAARRAERVARVLQRKRTRFSAPGAWGLLAQAALLRGNRNEARVLAEKASTAFARFSYVSQHAFAMMEARLARRESVTSVAVWAQEQEIKNLDRFLMVSAPALLLI